MRRTAGAILRQGLEGGINFFDTAIGYQSGTSEQYLGRALRDFAWREEVVVATKFLPRTNEEIANGISGQEHIRRMVDKSLQNLGMDYIDLYIYHMWDYQTPLYDILEGLNQVVKAGKVRYLGISNCFAWQLCKANDLARAEGFAPFVSLQGHYNLLFREEEREMFPFCREENIALTPYSALAGGRLSKHPGETSQRLEQDSYAKGKYDGAADQDAPHSRPSGCLGTGARRVHDGDLPGLAADQGHLPCGGNDQALPCNRRTPGGGPDPHPRGMCRAGGPLHPPRPGGGDGPEHPVCRPGRPCVVHWHPKDRLNQPASLPLVFSVERPASFHGFLLGEAFFGTFRRIPVLVPTYRD